MRKITSEEPLARRRATWVLVGFLFVPVTASSQPLTVLGVQVAGPPVERLAVTGLPRLPGA